MMFGRDLLCRAWTAFANVAGAVLIAAIASVALLTVFGSGRGPVVSTSDFRLHTPRVQVGDTFTFSVWRESSESCPGTVVISFSPMGEQSTVVSARYPLATPGFRSPPRLTITRQLPRQVGPGEWFVRVGIESNCPTRTQFDVTAEFVLEVFE